MSDSISFMLPFALPSLNVRDRQHWTKRRREKISIAWHVKSTLWPLTVSLAQAPWSRVRVTVTRHSAGALDADNLSASVKDLLDALCVPSRTHPAGVGLIVDDAPDHCELVVRQERSKRAEARTWVMVERLA